ncbi:hypothetical protein HG537_0F04880 [Torulaspora globosa]|uniref:Symplekin/Pta1 N-terminal domain-containing protein n=1 Tax=Torulaspora globosa TaxID=48254 RepID=A0A7H9HY20_9SACH|nr:hypothetical protein HG537_0F04880 [Torulaspora sp. CBS 2947]
MSVTEMNQLYQAEKLAMENSPEQMLPKVLETAASLYISEGTAPVLKKELSRFIARLLLEVITHDSIASSQKPFIASQHLDCLWSINRNVKDLIAYKYSVLAFSACYPLLFDLVAKTSNRDMWNVMCEMKSFIASNWNSVYPLEVTENDPFINARKNIGCKLATAKFLSQIIIVHTSRNGNNVKAGSVSISSVPDSHPVISNKSQLESEAKKFLDILLNYLIEEPMMVSSVFNGVLNCLAFIMKQRPQATMRILSGLLKFNVDAKYQVDDVSVLNYRMSKRFVERCYKNFVQFGLKSQLIKSSGQMASQQTKLSKISQTLHIIGEETKSKGILNFDAEQVENKITSKERQKYLALKRKQATAKVNRNAVAPMMSPPAGAASSTPQPGNSASPPVEELPVDTTGQMLLDLQRYTMSKNNIAGFFNNSPIAIDTSYCAIYSLMNSKNSEQDVSKLPQDIMIKLCSEAFYSTDTTKMISGLSIVASRYTDLMNKVSQLQQKQQQQQETGINKRKVEEEDEASDSKRIKKEDEVALASNVADNEAKLEDEYDYDSTKDQKHTEIDLIKPQAMTEEEKMKHLERIVQHIMDVSNNDESSEANTALVKDQGPLQKIKLLQWSNKESWLHILTRLCTRGVSHRDNMSNFIRQTLYNHFMDDFNGRIGMALEWLGEEWYYESLSSEQPNNYPNYDHWSSKFLDGLIPFLENQHRRIFIRLMSELPRIEQLHIDKIRPICIDPARSSLGFQTLKFLVMFRPPVKPMVKTFLQQIMQEDSTIVEQCNAILTKFYQ